MTMLPLYLRMFYERKQRYFFGLEIPGSIVGNKLLCESFKDTYGENSCIEFVLSHFSMTDYDLRVVR